MAVLRRLRMASIREAQVFSHVILKDADMDATLISTDTSRGDKCNGFTTGRSTEQKTK